METPVISSNKRKSFSQISTLIDIPDLLSIQTKAYQQFLQEFVAQEARKPIGLEGVLKHVFPIEDTHRNYILEYKTYNYTSSCTSLTSYPSKLLKELE